MCLLLLVRWGQPYCLPSIPLGFLFYIRSCQYLLCTLRSKYGRGWLTLYRPGWLWHSPTPSQTWPAPLRETQRPKRIKSRSVIQTIRVCCYAHHDKSDLGKKERGIFEKETKGEGNLVSQHPHCMRCALFTHMHSVYNAGTVRPITYAHWLFKAMCHSISGNWVYSDVFLVIFL